MCSISTRCDLEANIVVLRPLLVFLSERFRNVADASCRRSCPNRAACQDSACRYDCIVQHPYTVFENAELAQNAITTDIDVTADHTGLDDGICADVNMVTHPDCVVRK